MDEFDIRRVVKSFGHAARRCKEGGIDGIETVGGGHLIGQFLSPSTNVRTDGFGGSVENRCRFGLMVFEEMRRQVGDDFLLGFRHVIDEGEGTDSLSFEQSLEIALIFQRAGFVDFFNALYGKFDTERALAVQYMPGMDSPIAPWLAAVGNFRREVKLPVFHAARIADIATARHGIREGMLDMVGMTRPHIADPYIVKKIEAGVEHTIRPCVGATHCQSNLRPRCLHNPATGREGVIPQIIVFSKEPKHKVVIVGAGPAGLEAARVSAERGHKVVIFEAANSVGGQVLLGCKASWRRDLLGIIDWRMQELDRLGVEVRTNAFAEGSDVLAEEPDVVIVATGGMPDINWIDGAEHVTSAWDVLAGYVPLKQDVIVYDGTGRHPAPQIAEMAANTQGQMFFVSIDAQLCQELTYAERITWKTRLYKLGIPTLFDHEIVRVEPHNGKLLAIFRNIVSESLAERVTSQIVVERGTLPVTQLFDELREASSNRGVTDLDRLIKGEPQAPGKCKGEFQLHRIGDAVSSRNIHSAMLDAVRLCSLL
jgi:hypothetical protein